ncbi:amino acid ABC transporter permease [Butyrivibrio sp. JL13D10]|uniref:amino acid ABC transporter permease n=1 Tax=Butyrivibrio sp. JL13D10 TaxID=3236815 RepID=UPI0038B5001E
MTFNTNSFYEALISAFKYAPVTLELTAVTFVISLVIGTVIATIRHYRVPVISQILGIFVTVYMGLPMMVALVLYNLLFMTFYNDFAGAFHIATPISDINPIFIGFFALIMGTSCSVSESVRGAFRGIDKIQYEAGYSIGFSRKKTLFRIIFPQMVPILLPGMQNTLIGLLKASNLVSAISVTEIMTGALLPSLLYYSYLESYVAAAIVYWIIGITIEVLAHFAENRSGKYLKRLAA